MVKLNHPFESVTDTIERWLTFRVSLPQITLDMFKLLLSQPHPLFLDCNITGFVLP